MRKATGPSGEENVEMKEAEMGDAEDAEERKQVVVRVEEGVKKEQEVGEMDTQLPPAISQRYKVKKNAKKRTVEPTESQGVMGKIDQIAEKVKEEIFEHEEGKKTKKRDKKKVLKSKFENEERLDGEEWKDMLNKCKSKIGNRLTMTSNPNPKSSQGKGRRFKRNPGKKPSSTGKPKGNRFAGLESNK